LLTYSPMPALEELELAAFRLSPALARRTLSPALVIDRGRVVHNVERVLERIGDPARWRPHVKTTKSPRIWRELVERGVRRFKCATTREARELAGLLAEQGVEGDVLLAHPARGPALEELGEIAAAHLTCRFAVLSEDPAHVAQVPAGVGLFVDLNPGFDRTGIPFDRREDILAVARAAGDRLRGLHAYEGHRTESDPELRRERAFAGYRELLELAAALEAEGLAIGELCTSGTPAFPCALDFPGFAELEAGRHTVSPGTVVLHDARSQEQVPGLGLLPAAVVFTRVVSRPASGRFTCDAGSKSIAAEAGHPCAFAVGHPEFVARVPSEEHLPFECAPAEVPELGSELYLVPRHVCPTVNLAETALLVEDGEELERFPVSGRAHDLVARGEQRP